MGCIDAEGNITRTAELILLAARFPLSIEQVAEECDLPLFRVRSAVRELVNAGLMTEEESLFQMTSDGVQAVEGRRIKENSS